MVEIYTVQALPRSLRAQATAAVADLVAPGGTLVAIQSILGEDDDPDEGPPWPLTRAEIEAFGATGSASYGSRRSSAPAGRGRPLWRAELTR